MKNENGVIAIYSRKSKYTGKGESIGNQVELCREYIRLHFSDKDAEKAIVFEDEGFSGGNMNRPAFQRMMERIEKGEIKALVVYRLDRVSRNVSDFSGIKNYFNDFYARDTSRKIRAVQRAKGERGERVGNTIPYGYMKDPDNPKQYIPDPETAPIVKRIFEMYASGIGIVKICDRLSAEKILCPSVYALHNP